MDNSFWGGLVVGLIVGQFVALLVLALVSGSRLSQAHADVGRTPLAARDRRRAMKTFDRVIEASATALPAGWSRMAIEKAVTEAVCSVLSKKAAKSCVGSVPIKRGTAVGRP